MASAISFDDANSGFQAGIINGPVNTEFHHHTPPNRPETPPNPSVVIPFSRDTEFVERGIILDQIHQKCAVSGSRTALVGLGGVGKSQLAIEYAYRTRDLSPETWVFWVHASNAARFGQGFRDIANRVKVPGRQDPKADIFQLVCDWLSDDRKGRWLLILDNLDDAGFLVEARYTSQDSQTDGRGNRNLLPLVSYLPQCLNGSILITTRSKHVALKLLEPRDIVAIEPMSKADALTLFEKKLEGSNAGEDVAELAEALEFMPLAIVQAAAYISQRAPRYSVKEYLHDFQKSDRKKTRLLNYESEQLRRDREAKNSIIITWQISFDHIRKIRPSAADLLSLMSFFDRQGIPEAVLRNEDEQRDLRQDQKEIDASHSDDDKDDISQSSVNEEFENDVLVLRNYSFISVNLDGTTFEMHRLVQLATQKWLEAHKQQERWKQKFIKNLNVQLPTGEYENWVRCEKLFPHTQLAVAQQPEEEDSLRDWASILYKAAWYAWKMGKGLEAEKMSVQAMEVRERILGREHNNTLESMALVGIVYNLRGGWDAAEELQLQVLETSRKKLGANHPDTLTSMANLASTYRNQGRWDAAEELQLQVLETGRKKLGADHPDTLTCIANLASTYWNQGQWDAAEELQLQVLETSRKKLGANHPDTLTSMANLASTYRNQGRWDAAEELQLQVLETSRKKLGADHPDTLTCIANLALTYLNQGRWDAAEELQLQVLETRRKKLGANHPDTLTSMANLALTYRNQGRWDAAEELQLQVLEKSRKKLGANHPDTLTCIANLASTYLNQGRWDAAEELQLQVLETRRKKLGTDHPSTLHIMHNLAYTWKSSGRGIEAIGLMEECVQSRQRVLRPDHPHTLLSQKFLVAWKAEQEDAVE